MSIKCDTAVAVITTVHCCGN